MIDRLKNAFNALPPKVRVFLVGLFWAAVPPTADAIIDAAEGLITGAEPINRVSLTKVLMLGAVAGYGAARNYVAQSPMPRRVWTWAERQAEWQRQAALKEGRPPAEEK